MRDDASYSQWRNLVVRDGSGSVTLRASRPASGAFLPVPSTFSLSVDLHRPEIARTILFSGPGGSFQLGIDRTARTITLQQYTAHTYYFPQQPGPFLAEDVPSRSMPPRWWSRSFYC